jgi:hypothetical protein
MSKAKRSARSRAEGFASQERASLETFPGDLRHRVQEQGRAAAAGRGGRFSAVAAGRSSGDGQEPDTGAEEIRKPDDQEPFAALAFKIMTDPFVGQLAFIRVFGRIEERRQRL